MRLLIVEDEAPKREHIIAFIGRENLDFELEIAKSVRSAIESLRKSIPDLILLDMSLPTYDVGANEPGGRPQGFGGIEIMRYMDRLGMVVPIIVVTAYEAFNKGGKDVDLRSLAEELKSEHPETFRGIVYFNSMFEEWSRELIVLINACTRKGEHK